eukprot:scaffold625_cov420-Prasinococcus_capsulatus_cf.AAC.52
MADTRCYHLHRLADELLTALQTASQSIAPYRLWRPQSSHARWRRTLSSKDVDGLLLAITDGAAQAQEGPAAPEAQQRPQEQPMAEEQAREAPSQSANRPRRLGKWTASDDHVDNGSLAIIHEGDGDDDTDSNARHASRNAMRLDAQQRHQHTH